MSVSNYFKGLWLLHRGRQKENISLLQDAIDAFTHSHQTSKTNHNIRLSEASRMQRGMAFIELHRCTEDISWLKKAISDLSTTYDLVSYDGFRLIWMHTRDALSLTLVKLATHTRHQENRHELISKALRINEELFLRRDTFSKSFLRSQYVTLVFAHSLRGDIKTVGSIFQNMIDDEKIKLSSFEIYEKRLEIVDTLISQLIFSTEPNQLIQLMEAHQVTEEYDLLGFNQKDAFKLLNLRIKNNWLIFKFTKDLNHLKRGLKDIQDAANLAKKPSRIAQRQMYSLFVEKHRFECLLATQTNDKNELDSVISECSMLLQSTPKDIDEPMLNECRGVLCLSYLARSKINDGNASDTAEALKLIRFIEGSDSGSNNVKDYDLIQTRYKKEIAKVDFNKAHTSSDGLDTYVSTQAQPFKISGVDAQIIFKKLFGELEFLASISVDEFSQLETMPSKKYLSIITPIFERQYTSTLDQQNDTIERLILENVMIGELGTNIKDLLEEVVLPIVECLDNQEFVNSYSEWSGYIQTPFNVSIFQDMRIPESIVRLYYFIEYYNLRSDDLTLLSLSGQAFGGILPQIQFNEYLAREYVKLNRRDDALTQLRLTIDLCLNYLASENLSLSSFHRQEILTGLSTFYTQDALISGEFSGFDSAFSVLEQAFSLIDKNETFDAWLHNRTVYLSTIREKYNFTGDMQDWSTCINAFEDIVSKIPFEKYPNIWCDLQFQRCELWATASGFEDDKNLLIKILTQFNLYHTNIRLLINSTSSDVLRRKYIQQVSKLGDNLALLCVMCGYTGSALKCFDEVRGLRLTTSLVEAELPPQQAAHVKELRLNWEKETKELEARSFHSLRIPAMKSSFENDHEERGSQAAENAYVLYKQALAEAGIGNGDEIDVDVLFPLIPDNALIVLPILTEHSSRVMILGNCMNQEHLIETISLENVKLSQFESLLKNENGWLDVYNEFRSNAGQSNSVLEEKFVACDLKLQEISQQLGTKLIQPIYDFLQEIGYWPHIEELMFVPNGTLSMLPMQAAKINVSEEFEQEKYLIEEVAISMWPTISSIIHYHKKTEAIDENQSILLIDSIRSGKPNVPEYISDNNELRQTYIANPDRQNFSLNHILESLSSSPYSFIYSHGHWNNDDPENSSLELVEGESSEQYRLSVKDIRRSTLKQSRLLFLGACETSMIGVDFLPNEFVGLPAAFMEAGFKGVISTQWMVHGEYCLKVADEFFEEHFERNTRPAIALQKAILKVSSAKAQGEDESDFGELMFWAPFVLYGS